MKQKIVYKHHIFYSDLHKNGIEKSIESVGINEPIIITMSEILDRKTFEYSKSQIERRASELKSDVKWLEFHPKTFDDENFVMVWFSILE